MIVPRSVFRILNDIMAMKENVIQVKSYSFSVKTVKLGYALFDKREFILSKQLIRSATSVGANVEEAIGAYTKKEFHHKIGIAYKEARESKYWIRLLHDTGWIDKASAEDFLRDIEELLRLMGAIMSTLRKQN